MASLHLKLLGGFEASMSAGRSLEISGRKNQALLAYLASHAGKKLSREKLTGMLWSDRGEAQARSSLRQTLLTLRRDLAGIEPSPLLVEGDVVAIDASATSSDVAAFERLASSNMLVDLRQAADLYRGDLLDGLAIRDQAFDEWLAVERSRLREIAIGVFNRLIEHLAGAEAVSTATRLIALDPLREASHRALMKVYAAQGQREQALRQYQTCCDILRRELDVEPSSETTALHREIGEGKYRPPAVDLKPQETPSSVESLSADADLAPRTKPSIAVLPFTNMSGDPEQEYFSDGITEDIITEISRFPELFVIARNSSFLYRDKQVDVRRIGRELGVHFVLEGSVRKLGSRVRITAQLIHAATGNHLWAERYDRDLADVFALQEELAHAVASTVGGRIQAAGRERAIRLSPTGLTAYDLVLRASALHQRFTRKDMTQARALAQRAIEIDPTYARAHAQYANSCVNTWMAHWTAERESMFRDAYHHAERAVVLDSSDTLSRCMLGFMKVFAREYEEARVHIENALASNPNEGEARLYHAVYLVATGQSDTAIEQLDLAKRQNPFDYSWALWIRGAAYFTAGRYGDAIAVLSQIPEPINEIRGWLAASYAQAGRLTEAKASLTEFLRVAKYDMVVYPGDRLKDWEPYWHGAMEYRDQRDFEHLFEALRKAGLSA